MAAFSRAVNELADCYPLLKPRLLKAMAMAAGADGQLNPAEREIIASVAAVMDCPVPTPGLKAACAIHQKQPGALPDFHNRDPVLG